MINLLIINIRNNKYGVFTLEMQKVFFIQFIPTLFFYMLFIPKCFIPKLIQYVKSNHQIKREDNPLLVAASNHK